MTSRRHRSCLSSSARGLESLGPLATRSCPAQSPPVRPSVRLSSRSLESAERTRTGSASPTSRPQCGGHWEPPGAGGSLPAEGGHVGRCMDGHEPRRPSRPKAGPEGLGWGTGPAPQGSPPPHSFPHPGSPVLHGSLGGEAEAASRPHAAFPAHSHYGPAHGEGQPPAAWSCCQDAAGEGSPAGLASRRVTSPLPLEVRWGRNCPPSRAHGTEEGAVCSASGDAPAARGPVTCSWGCRARGARAAGEPHQHKGALVRGDLTSSTSDERAAGSQCPPCPAGGAR